MLFSALPIFIASNSELDGDDDEEFSGSENPLVTGKLTKFQASALALLLLLVVRVRSLGNTWKAKERGVVGLRAAPLLL